MTSRPKRRDAWHKTKDGTWTCTFGHRGEHQVRLFENRKSRYFYADLHAPINPDGARRPRHRKTLGTADRTVAYERGRALYVELLTGTTASQSPVPSVVRLGEVCDRFLCESPAFLDNKVRTQNDTRGNLAIIRSVIGDARDVRTLTVNDVRQYEPRRRAGGIHYGSGKTTGPVRQRVIQADIKLLRQVLAWACTVTTLNGQPWLDRNPLMGTKVRGESDVRRPVTTQERFEATRREMVASQTRYENEAREATSAGERAPAESRSQSWIRAELGLFLLEATGRRRGAIMGLRWTDVNYVSCQITWRAESDKKQRTSVVPYPVALFDELRRCQQRLGAVGGYMFPRHDDPSRPAPAELLSQWIQKAETTAGLPKLNGGVCHPYRRKWRSERPNHPTKAVAVAGGWKDEQTMLRCYDFPEDADLLAVTSEPRKRHEPPAASGPMVAV